MSMNKEQKRYSALGAFMPKGYLFIDVDSRDFDIYLTEGGCHVIAKLDKKGFDYNFNRIRISPKYDEKGRIVNKSPELLFCHCPSEHKDKRLKGKIVPY